MLDQYRELIDELLETPGIVRRLITEHESATATFEAGRLLRLLRDRDVAVLTRLQTMTRDPDPYLRSLAPVGDPTPQEVSSALLDELDTARGDLVSLLMNLTLRDWERTAIDETHGKVSLSDEVERHVEFDEEHLAKITALLSAG